MIATYLGGWNKSCTISYNSISGISLLSIMRVQDRKSRMIMWQGVVLLLLIFLAVSRWLPGSDPLSPETSSRGILEIILLCLATLLAVLFFGLDTFFSGFKLPTFIILIFFCAWAAITAIWAPSAVLALGKAAGLLMIVLIVAALAYQLSQSGVPSEKVILPALLIFVIFLLVDNRFTYGAFLPSTVILERQRLLLGHNHPNESAIYLATLIFFCVVLSYGSRWSRRLFFFLIGLFAFFLLIRTDSRTSLIALLLTVFLLIALKMPTSRFRILTILIGVICAILLLSALLIVLSENGTLQEVFRTVLGRVELWKTAISMLPAINIGGNGYYAARFYLLPIWGWASHAHNALVEMIFDLGIVGVLMLFSFFLSFLPNILRPGRAPVFFCFLIFTLLQSITDVEIFIPSILMTLICLLVFEQQFLNHKKGRMQKNFQEEVAVK